MKRWKGNRGKKRKGFAKERKIQTAILNIKKQFGKNAILKGLNYEEAPLPRNVMNR